jgi:hypothetical protein
MFLAYKNIKKYMLRRRFFRRRRGMRRMFRRSRYSSYRGRRWNKKKKFNRFKRRLAGISSVSEKKFYKFIKAGFLARDFMTDSSEEAVINHPFGYLCINPYNTLHKIT